MRSLPHARRGAAFVVVIATIAVLPLGACRRKAEPTPTSTTAATLPSAGASASVEAVALTPFQPLPRVAESSTNPVTDDKVALGRMLYFDARLSRNHDVSCESCHHLGRYGVDGEPTSTGHRGQRGTRNAPTVYNAAVHFRQFWDGRAADVEEQAKGPILNPVEMAMPDEANVAATLRSMPGYVDAFARAFPGEPAPSRVSLDNAAKAIAAFERRLIVRSRWDAFLEGDRAALTNEEIGGLRAFVAAGCPACHSGAAMGGGAYQKLGLVAPWPDTRDLGRFALTKAESDRMVFTVPSLRNVTKTAPYFHDGSVPTLETAVRLMGRHQLGKELDDASIASIVAFLGSLTGPLPPELVEAPVLPASTPATPKPRPE